MSSKIKTIFLPLLLLVGLSSLYLHNLSRSVYGGDVGDLVTAAAVGGISHPPGYPLFTLLGFLLTKLPLSHNPAFLVGLISAFSSSFSVIIFYFLINKLTKNALVSIVSSLILSFSYLFWFYSEIAEVFSLNTFFAILLFYLAICFKETGKSKFLYLLSFFASLSLTNHQTIIFIFPSLLLLIIPRFLKEEKRLKKILFSFFVSILGFLPYLYVPIAASLNPPLNWDHVKDLSSFLHLLLRKDYGTFNAGVFAPPSIFQRLIILKTYFLEVIFQLTLPVILLSLLGAFYLALKDKLLFFSLFLGFVISGPLFIAYSGFPILSGFYLGVYERFFLLSSLILLLFFPFGLLYFVDFVQKFLSRKSYKYLLLLVFLIIPLSLLRYNFPKTDLHNLWVGDNLARDFLTTLPKDSVILLSGDTVLFNVWYARYALHYRPDVQIVNLNGLAGDDFIDKKRKELIKNDPKNKKDNDLVIKIIEDVAKKRPVYSYQEIEPQKGDKLFWAPYGLTFKLFFKKDDLPKEEEYNRNILPIWNRLHVPSSNSLAAGSLSVSDISSVYASALLATGNFYLSEYNDKPTALSFYKRAQGIAPSYFKSYEILGVYYLSFDRDCNKARDNLKKAIDLYPFEKLSYFFLYTTYKTCFNDKLAGSVVLDYQHTFGSNFFSDLKDAIKNYK